MALSKNDTRSVLTNKRALETRAITHAYTYRR